MRLMVAIVYDGYIDECMGLMVDLDVLCMMGIDNVWG